MPVFFKSGKFAVKKYEKLSPEKLVYIKAGKYIVDLDNDLLICLSDSDQGPINIKEGNPVGFYLGIDVNRKRDKRIPLTLDRKGRFFRTDGKFGFSNIEMLFNPFA